MNDTHDVIVTMLTELLERAGKGDVAVGLDTPIHGDGLGLDSLETAELSALLEDHFGSDPFGAGLMPVTVAEIIAFYAGAEEPGAPVNA